MSSLFTPPTHKLVRNIYDKYNPIVSSGSFGDISTGAFYFMTGQFTGWITAIGIVKNFKGVRFFIKPSYIEYPITSIRVRIITDTHAGTVLADKTIDVLTKTLTEQLIEVEFDSEIENASDDYLVLSWSSNGRSGVRGVDATNYPASDTPSPPTTFPKVRYFNHSDPVNTTSLQATGSQIVQYVEFFRRDTNISERAVADKFVADLLKHPTLGSIFDTKFSTTTVQAYSASVNWTYEAGAFSGFIQPIGAHQNFDQVKLNVRYKLSESPIRKVRCVIRRNDYQGDVLFDETVDVETQLGVTKEVVFTSSTLVKNEENDDLVLGFFTDGKCGINILPSIIQATPWIRYSTQSSISNTSSIEVSSEPSNKSFWFGLYRREDSTTSSTLRKEIISSLGLSGIMTVDGEIQMPSTLRMTEGVEMDVYFTNIIRSKAKYLEFEPDVDSTVGGIHANDFWRFLPSGADSGTVTFAAYHRDELVTQKTVNVEISGSTSGAGVTRKILMVGDSITDADTITAQIKTRFDADGSMTGTLIGTNGPGSGNFNEGYSGKTFLWHYTDPDSPFYNGGVFDFANYLSSNGFTMTSGDWFIVMLGTNDVFNLSEDDLAVQIPVILNTASSMIGDVQADVSGIRIGICTVSPACFNQDGFGNPSNYLTGRTRRHYEVNRKTFNKAIIDTFGGSESSNIYVIPTHAVVDVYNNFPTTTRALNAHNPTTVTVQNNGVHPTAAGGYQMGDCIYSIVKTIA